MPTDEGLDEELDVDEEAISDSNEDDLPEAGESAPGLTEEQIEEITTLLRAGRRLPPHLFPTLFEAPREYQLSYRGKSRAADVLADTMAVPLQPVRTFGSNGDGWANMLVFGDNLQVLRQLMVLKDAGQLRNPDGSDGFRVCYIDPPFATEREFRGGQGQVAYSDRVAGAEFVESLRRRLILIRELLADDGTLYVHLDWKKGHYVKVILDELFGPSHFRNEIIWWYYNKMQGNINRFPSNHDSIYAYARSANPVFNPIMEEREEIVRQIKREWDPVGKKLVNAKNDEGHVIYVDKDDRRVDDVWRLSMLQPADQTERVDFPTQKPATLLALIIAASSNPGDLVLDAFVGSGTTAVVAQQLGRPWVAIDSGKYAIYWSQARLLKMASQSDAEPPFTLFNAGLYDYKTLKDLPRERYIPFVLQLFQCRQAKEDIRGVTFDGRIGDDPVLVYDFEEHPDATIGEAYVEDLARICGRALGDRCFIIAPASVIEPYEDYLVAGDTKFFLLRIPYSVIAELHKRAFSELRQPTSATKTNALIDSVGFDFIQPPRVECDYSTKEGNLIVKIRHFESEAFAARPTTENIADLAMVLVDHSYDDEVFRLDSAYFADDLVGTDWVFGIPEDEAGDRIMIIYIDLYGNEFRETKRKDQFGAGLARRGRSAARGTPVRKVAKKSVAKKAPAKKSVAKKAPVTKAATKKAAAKRGSARKASKKAGPAKISGAREAKPASKTSKRSARSRTSPKASAKKAAVKTTKKARSR